MIMEHVTGMMVGIVFWATVAALVLVPVYLRFRDRARLHETLRIAYEKGQPVPPELIAALQSGVSERSRSSPERDLRRAIVLIAVGLGLCGLGLGLWYGLMSVSYTAAYVTGYSVAGSGAIPGFIGVAYLVLWLGERRKPKA
jgi:hypothetical protein